MRALEYEQAKRGWIVETESNNGNELTPGNVTGEYGTTVHRVRQTHKYENAHMLSKTSLIKGRFVYNRGQGKH